MSLITVIPGVTFTDSTLPKLYRDTAITSGTQFCYDALDTYSWPKQSAPSTGDNWIDLTPNASNAVASNSALGFSGGFTKAAAGYFTVPNTGKVASNAAGFLSILWIKYGTQPTSGYTGLAGCFDSNGTNQYGFTINNDSSNGLLVANANGTSAVLVSHPTSGTIMQLAISLKLIGGTYQYGFYKNGALIQSGSAGTSILQPTTTPKIGYTSAGAFSDTFVGTIYRALFDNTSTLPGQTDITSLVLSDWTANNIRFS